MKQLLFPSIVLLLAATGCQASYQREEISNVSQSEVTPTSSVSLQHVQVTLGDIVTATVIPYNSDNNPMIGTVTSDNPNVILVEGAEGNKWAFSGVNIGSTTLHFVADGETVATVVAKVCDQGDTACATAN